MGQKMKRASFVVMCVLLCTLAGGTHAQGRAVEEGEDFSGKFWPAVSVSHTQVRLSSKLDENIARVAVEEGQSVSKGQLLIKFDSRLIEERIALAEIDAEFAARLKSAQTRHEYYRREFQRSEDLEFAAAEWERDKARFEMDMALQDWEELKRSKKRADQQLSLLNTQAQDFIILSPIDGAVSQVWAEEAEMASEGQPLVEVIDPHLIEVRVHLPEQHVKDVAFGQPAMVRFAAADKQELAGTVHVVSPYVDSSSGTFMVKVLVEPATDDVKPGMGCEVRFVARQRA